MTRDLTNEFLTEANLLYPVKVFHETFRPSEDIQKDSIVFILNPQKINQDELKMLLKHDSCCVLYNSDGLEDGKQHPVKLLLADKNVNEHLRRIKGLNKNIVEMYTVKFRTWDFLGITTSYRQLFNIRNTGYCFMEYPVISENTLNLDDVFIQESLKTIDPRTIVSKYLNIIEASYSSKLERMNINNAFQKVFKFYKSNSESYSFGRETEDLEFLVDVLKLESLGDKTILRAELIGALTSACAYLVHAGYPQSYETVISKLMSTVPQDGNNAVSFRHITQKDLSQLRDGNTFLYYHLTCRIPNQYAIALFDIYLTETDNVKKVDLGNAIEKWLVYLKNRISELSLSRANLLWEFKKDQEIGAMSGTAGLLALYKKAVMDGDISAYAEAETYFSKAIEYAHPTERNRDINYYVQCRLSQMAGTWREKDKINDSCHQVIDELAELYKGRFSAGVHDTFDVMFSIGITAAAGIFESEARALEIYRRAELDWCCVEEMMNERPYQYSVYLAAAFLLLAPESLVNKLNLGYLIQKSVSFFRLDDDGASKDSIMDLIALKFMIAHGYYLSRHQNDENRKVIEHYTEIVDRSPLYSKWTKDCTGYFSDCMSKPSSGADALKLIYSIPY